MNIDRVPLSGYYRVWHSRADLHAVQIALLFAVLGLDLLGMIEILDDDPDSFQVILEERAALLLAGDPTWRPTPDAVP